MHACGHDGHMAMLLGTAMVLRELTQEVPGTVAFIFQPAEELLKGAKMMIEGHILEYAPFNFIYAFHLWPALPLGHVGVKPGWPWPARPSSEPAFPVAVGMGPIPHLASDAVVAAANWITLLQNIVSRKVDPTEPAVVSVGRIEGGSSLQYHRQVGCCGRYCAHRLPKDSGTHAAVVGGTAGECGQPSWPLL